MNDEILHYGTKYHSGRFPYGSGENPFQHDKRGFYREYKELQKKGMSQNDIAKYFDKKYYKGQGVFNTSVLRGYVTVGREQIDRENITRAMHLRNDKQMGPKAIGDLMGVPESTVRGWLEPSRQKKISQTRMIANTIKDQVDNYAKKGLYLDIGGGTETALGVSQTRLNAALSILQDEGYKYHVFYSPRIGKKGDNTTIKVLAAPGTEWGEVMKNQEKITPLSGIQPSVDKTYFEKIPKPVSINSNRVHVRYNEEGGADKDGCIEIRPGVKDLDLGENNYAQVRIAVDGTHYLKGMAVYGDPKDFPKGTDVIFNTHNHVGTPKMDTFKELKKVKTKDGETSEVDWDNPFGASIKRVNKYIDKDGKEQQTAMNIVNQDEDWDKWSRNLASQFLSKQNRPLAKRQLQIAYDRKADEFEKINSLTNPVLKKQLLNEFADSCDSDAVTLKAAPLPRQATHVILPLTSIKKGEIYAPNYDNGEEVVLVRFPHAGPFESPRLKVNNNIPEGKRIIGNGKTAVGISAKDAAQLSGADFDGDTVVVLPTRNNNIKTDKPLKGLEDFDTVDWYPAYSGMPKVGPKSGFQKQTEMGKITNLISDMTLMGAPNSDVVKAVRYSMVVIDAEKHNLDWRRAYDDNQIDYLKTKYRGSARSGASTLISRASAETHIPARREVTSPTDSTLTPEEKERWLKGEKIYKEKLNNDFIKFTPDTRVSSMSDKEKEKYYSLSKEERKIWKADRDEQLKKNLSDEQWKAVADAKKYYKQTGKVPEDSKGLRFKVNTSKVSSTQMADHKDAHELSSGLPMEEIYANHANKLKSLGNRARAIARHTDGNIYNPTAYKTYAKEVASLLDKLKVAELNRPLERQAQLIANKTIKNKVAEDPDLKFDKDHYKKVEQKALAEARAMVGSKKTSIPITEKEWEAIQAGAFTKTKLMEIFRNTDNEQLKKLATPHKDKNRMSEAQINRAKRLLESGHTQAEVAQYYGVSVSTINKLVNI